MSKTAGKPRAKLLKAPSKREVLRELTLKGVSHCSTSTFVEPDKRIPLVATYCRVSTERQAELGNLDMQETQVKELYRRHFGNHPTAKLVGAFKDDGYSMEEYEEDRQIWRLMEKVASGEVNIIICKFFNRIFRSSDPRVNARITKACNDKTVTIIDDTQRQVFDPSNPVSTLMNQLTSQIGVMDKSTTVSKLQSNRRTRMQESDCFVPSLLPYGYDVLVDRKKKKGEAGQKTIIMVPEEAAVIADIFRLYLNESPQTVPSLPPPPFGRHVSDKMIARHLNSNGFTREKYVARGHAGLKAKSRWQGQTIRYVLTNPFYMGKMTITFRETAEGSLYRAGRDSKTFDVPAVVAADSWERVQKLREKFSEACSGRLNPLHRESLFWLHGKIVCSTCGQTLKGRVNPSLQRYYRCEGKKKPGDAPHDLIRALDVESLLEPYFREKINSWLTRGSFDDLEKELSAHAESSSRLLFLEKSMNSLKSKIDKIKAAQRQLYENQLDPELEAAISREVFIDLARKKKEELAEAEAALGELEAQLRGLGKKDSKEQLARRLSQVAEQFRKEEHTKFEMLQRMALSIIDRIEIKRLAPLDIRSMSREQIRHNFMMGRITPIQLRSEGWSRDKIERELGKSGRRSPLNWKIVMKLALGGFEEFHPAPSCLPAEVLPLALASELRQGASEVTSQRPVKIRQPRPAKDSDREKDGPAAATGSKGEKEAPGPLTLSRWGSRLAEKSLSVHQLYDERYLKSKERFEKMRADLAAGLGGVAEKGCSPVPPVHVTQATQVTLSPKTAKTASPSPLSPLTPLSASPSVTTLKEEGGYG